MTFWIYENWGLSRARLHRGDCSFCKEGRGRDQLKVRKGRPWKWHWPFLSRLKASQHLKTLDYDDKANCAFCARLIRGRLLSQKV